MRSRYGTVEAIKLTADRHEASRGLFATAELLVLITLCNVYMMPMCLLAAVLKPK